MKDKLPDIRIHLTILSQFPGIYPNTLTAIMSALENLLAEADRHDIDNLSIWLQRIMPRIPTELVRDACRERMDQMKNRRFYFENTASGKIQLRGIVCSSSLQIFERAVNEANEGNFELGKKHSNIENLIEKKARFLEENARVHFSGIQARTSVLCSEPKSSPEQSTENGSWLLEIELKFREEIRIRRLSQFLNCASGDPMPSQ